jgi:hypothetical protein
MLSLPSAGVSVFTRTSRQTKKRVTSAVYIGPAADAVRMICNNDDPITTKTKNPSITGPTAKSFFFVAPAPTAPLL